MSFSNIYIIDFKKLANLLTPPFLRKDKLIDWLQVLLKPLEEVNGYFNLNRKDSIYKVTHNGQVYSLQAVLNDKYDNTERRIRIVDYFIRELIYIYPEADNKPVYIYPEDAIDVDPVYIFDESIFDEVELDFVVLIPIEYKPLDAQELNILEIQIRSLINYYKLASKRYSIKWT